MFKKFMSFLMVAVFAIGSLGVQVFAADEDWTRLADFPAPIYMTTLAEHNGKIYVVGGALNPSYTRELHIYDIASNTWSKGADAPVLNIRHSANIINNKIYVLGVIKGVVNSPSEVHIYDIATDTWSTGTSISTRLNSFSTVAVGDDIYTFCGTINNSSTVDKTYKYNTVTDTWSELSPVPKKMFLKHNNSVLVNNDIYLIGGFNYSSPNTAYNTVYKYDITNDEWSLYDELPIYLYDYSLLQYNDNLYISGGYVSSSASTVNVPSVKIYNYNLADKVLVEETSMPSELKRNVASIIVNDNLYIIGGSYANNDRSNKVYSYELKPTPKTPAIHLLMRKGGEEALLSLSQNLSINTTYNWTSENPAVASVDANGNVKALEIGTTKIYAESLDGTYKESIAVKVIDTEEIDDSIVLAIDVTSGKYKELWLTDELGTVWSSLNPAVASVDPSGKVTGLSKGLAVIEGTLNGTSHYINVRVR